MKHVLEGKHESIGWGSAVLLSVLSLPLMAIAVLVVRTFLVPLLVGAVVAMALLALFVPPQFRSWIGSEWHFTQR